LWPQALVQVSLPNYGWRRLEQDAKKIEGLGRQMEHGSVLAENLTLLCVKSERAKPCDHPYSFSGKSITSIAPQCLLSESPRQWSRNPEIVDSSNSSHDFTG